MVWEDSGLYFTLIFSSIVLAVVIIVGFILHKIPANARVLRPNRPGSFTATVFSGLPTQMLDADEAAVATQNGVQCAIYVLVLKLMMYMFFGMCLTCVVIVSMCATDGELNRYRQSADPDGCRGKSNSDCGDSPFCQAVSNTTCVPLLRSGLFDLSAANLGQFDSSWRLYIFAIMCVVCTVPLLIATRSIVLVLKRRIDAAHVAPSIDKFKFGGLGTVGARTVLIAGIPSDARLLTSADGLLGFLRADVEARVKVLEDRVTDEEKEAAKSSKADGAAKSEAQTPHNSAPFSALDVPSAPKEPAAADAAHIEPKAEGQPHREEEQAAAPPPVVDLAAPSWVLAERIVASSVRIIRCAPDDLVDLIEEEKATLTALTDSVAAEKLETDPEKKPVMKRPVPWKKVEAVDHDTKQLDETREKLREALALRGEQDMTGAVFVTFDRASTAYAFVRQFNDEAGVVGRIAAQVAGPRENVKWANLTVVGPVQTVRNLLMIIIFILLVFLWGIPVGFLGTLNNLATIPGVGPSFASVINVIPVTVLGTLSAYLPTIVITVFNILLPSLFRFFARLGGVKTTDAEMKTVLVMCAVFSVMSGIVMQAALQGGFAQAMNLISNPSGDAVRVLIIAIVSPSGGYWYTYLISAACLGLGIRFMELGPVIGSTILGKLASRQEEYDKLFDPRPTDFAFQSGRHVFFAAIGLLFHGTVAFLQPFALLYSAMAYLVERSLMLDSGARDETQLVDYQYVLSYLHCIVTLHTVATIGNVVICALKLSIGAPIIASLSIVGSLGLHAYIRHELVPVIFLTPERVAELEGVEGFALQPFSDDLAFEPEYSVYAIDEAAKERIMALEFPPVDRTWPAAAAASQAVELA